jgi:hypothetical protein
MRCRWGELLAVGVALTHPRLGGAQQVREIGIQTIGTFSSPAALVAGGYGALRTTGRTRLSLALGAGVSDRKVAWRGEILGHFLLSPEERRKAGFYVAGGVAGVEGAVGRGYLVLALGVEARPREASGWAAEVGFGGGFRVAMGYRWRWFPASAGQ